MLVTAAHRHHNEIVPVARRAARAATAAKFTPPCITTTRSEDKGEHRKYDHI
jgi:hypothetical protein